MSLNLLCFSVPSLATWDVYSVYLVSFERVSCSQNLGIFNDYRQTRIITSVTDRKRLTPEYGRWIWLHDADKYVYDNYDKAHDHVQSGVPFHNTNVPPGYVYEPWSVNQLMADVQGGEEVARSGNWT